MMIPTKVGSEGHGGIERAVTDGDVTDVGTRVGMGMTAGRAGGGDDVRWGGMMMHAKVGSGGDMAGAGGR